MHSVLVFNCLKFDGLFLLLEAKAQKGSVSSECDSLSLELVKIVKPKSKLK